MPLTSLATASRLDAVHPSALESPDSSPMTNDSPEHLKPSSIANSASSGFALRHNTNCVGCFREGRGYRACHFAYGFPCPEPIARIYKRCPVQRAPVQTRPRQHHQGGRKSHSWWAVLSNRATNGLRMTKCAGAFGQQKMSVLAVP